MKSAKELSARPDDGARPEEDEAQVRLSVNLNQEVADDLKAYAKRKGVSVTEAVRRAVTVLAFVDDMQRRGASLNVSENGTLKEILFL